MRNDRGKWGRVWDEVLRVVALLLGMFGLFGLLVLVGYLIVQLIVWMIT